HALGPGLVAAGRGCRPDGRPPPGGVAGVRLPRGAAVPFWGVPGRRLPGPGPRDRGLDAGAATRLRPGDVLDVYPPGRLRGPAAGGLADPGRLPRLGCSLVAPRRPGLALVCLLLAMVPQPAGGDA